uniref:hypothetical protein n=1 Tax=Kocuria rhizophila TaxID=72000 RepID=UPI001C92CDF3
MCKNQTVQVNEGNTIGEFGLGVWEVDAVGHGEVRGGEGVVESGGCGVEWGVRGLEKGWWRRGLEVYWWVGGE